MAKLKASVIDCHAVVPDRFPRTLSAGAAVEADSAWLKLPSLMTSGPCQFDDARLLERARQLGLARARSASAAAWLAMIACASAHHCFRGSVLGLTTSSTSATESTAFVFERDGNELGWKLADPFWLPNSIPSCIATSVFAALKLEGVALGFPGGVHGFFGALDHALMLLAAKAIQRAVVVTAEHAAMFYEELAERSGVRHSLPTGAVAIVLEPSRQLPGECVLERDFSISDTPDTKGARTAPSSRATYLNSFEADVPASAIFHHRAGLTSARSSETDFVIRETGETFSLSIRWLE